MARPPSGAEDASACQPAASAAQVALVDDDKDEGGLSGPIDFHRHIARMQGAFTGYDEDAWCHGVRKWACKTKRNQKRDLRRREAGHRGARRCEARCGGGRARAPPVQHQKHWDSELDELLAAFLAEVAHLQETTCLPQSSAPVAVEAPRCVHWGAVVVVEYEICQEVNAFLLSSRREGLECNECGNRHPRREMKRKADKVTWLCSDCLSGRKPERNGEVAPPAPAADAAHEDWGYREEEAAEPAGAQQQQQQQQWGQDDPNGELVDWAIACSSMKRLRRCGSFRALNLYFEERDCDLDVEEWCRDFLQELRTLFGAHLGSERAHVSKDLSLQIGRLLRGRDQQCLSLLRSLASEYLTRHVHNRRPHAECSAAPTQEAVAAAGCDAAGAPEVLVLDSWESLALTI